MLVQKGRDTLQEPFVNDHIKKVSENGSEIIKYCGRLYQKNTYVRLRDASVSDATNRSGTHVAGHPATSYIGQLLGSPVIFLVVPCSSGGV